MSLTARRAMLPHAARIVRCLAVVLALAVQIACGAGAPADDTGAGQLAALDAASVFCQSGTDHHHSGGAPLPHRLTEAALVHTGAHAAQHPVILAASPGVAQHSVVRDAHSRVQQARAPPAIFAVFCYPRGPPAIV